jgi:hypothetical protein
MVSGPEPGATVGASLVLVTVSVTTAVPSAPLVSVARKVKLSLPL